MEDGTCEGCTYNIVTISDDEKLIEKCRRFPPLLFVFEDEITQSFPDAHQRCGEFKEQT
jgi:hypothetical protein